MNQFHSQSFVRQETSHRAFEELHHSSSICLYIEALYARSYQRASERANKRSKKKKRFQDSLASQLWNSELVKFIFFAKGFSLGICVLFKRFIIIIILFFFVQLLLLGVCEILLFFFSNIRRCDSSNVTLEIVTISIFQK